MLSKLVVAVALLALTARAVEVALWTYPADDQTCDGAVTTSPLDLPHLGCKLTAFGVYAKVEVFNETHGVGSVWGDEACEAAPITQLPAINGNCLPAGPQFGSVWTQWETVGILTVKVRDSVTREAIPFVDVRCTNANGSVNVRRATCPCTGQEGTVRFPHLPWGTYTCTAVPKEGHDGDSATVTIGPTTSTARFEKARLKFRLAPTQAQAK